MTTINVIGVFTLALSIGLVLPQFSDMEQFVERKLFKSMILNRIKHTIDH